MLSRGEAFEATERAGHGFDLGFAQPVRGSNAVARVFSTVCADTFVFKATRHRAVLAIPSSVRSSIIILVALLAATVSLPH
jgi:hypothetical protein